MSDVHIPISQVTRVSKGLSGAKPKLWRSLEELSSAEDVKTWLHREFPEKASEFTDPEGRRQFLQLMGASVALAGLSSACTRQPAEAIVPYVKAPEVFIPGRPVFFATVLSTDGAAQGVLVESHMGRPTKIEGNPEHPGSLGATDHFAQAEILNLYDPDRAKDVAYRTETRTWSDFVAAIRPVLAAQKAIKGEGLRLLTQTVISPTLGSQINELLKQYPGAKWHVHDPIARRNAMDGARAAFGRALQPVYNFAAADVIISLDADFLGIGGDKVANARAFAARRSFDTVADKEMNRLYVAESSISITGGSADHRMAVRSAEVEGIARELASAVGVDVEKGALPASAMAKSIVAAMIEDAKARPTRTLVLAGESQPAFVHALAYAINEKLGSIGTTVTMTEPVEINPPSADNSIEALSADMATGKVDALFILGGNPVATATLDSGFATAMKDQSKVALRVRLGMYDDETSEFTHWQIPEAHPLETWGDSRAFDGTLSVQQPLIAPLYDGRSALEVVTALLGDTASTGYQVVQTAWKARVPGPANFEKSWRKIVHDGMLPASAFAPVAVKSVGGAWMSTKPSSNQGDLDIAFRLDPNVLDGRYANNGWMQELPKPLTKITWDNAALVSPKTAKRLSIPEPEGSARGTWVDRITLKVGAGQISIPAWVVPGHPDDTVTVYLGAGLKRSGRVGKDVGVDVQPLRVAASPWFRSGATVVKEGTRYAIGCTQDHWKMEDASDRGLLRTTSYENFKANPEFAKHEAEQGPQASLYPLHPYNGNKWGMSIDLSACIGCNACITACQSENNIPVVGKESITRGREMQWLRIDRYYEGESEAPAVHHQPVPCMQCENASCEVVCPVAATVHSDEGLNDMVYNRCVGTRYCSNNCAYKVRRFNFFLYSDWDTESLKLQKNPDVTVRSRGVMEKCTYCVQRVNEARINAKNEGRDIREGEIKTACQQVCPTQAIVFGDLNKADSAVSKKKASPRDYNLLHELNTRPRTSYLASVRNPHPSLDPVGSSPAGFSKEAAPHHG
ncbi:MAG: TAT-variant-translocated molybdopterin oxidoreductase [Vicinamibacteria bacterium]